MGNALARANDDDEIDDSSSPAIDDLSVTSGGSKSAVKGKRKRRRSNQSSDIDAESSSKLFKLDTPKYVYQKLFVEGCDSDVIVHALGRSWRLHRVYLEQCDYFRALFRGNWRDSHNNEYMLEILDKNITYVGLNNVFASLYNNEIEIDKEHIAGVIGAAAMLNLTSVLNRCANILSTYLSEDKILLCLRLSDAYGLTDNLNQALQFLKYSFWRYCLKITFLKELRHYWLAKILSSDILCVKENEMDLYIAIKTWIYLQNFPDECCCDEVVRGLSTSPLPSSSSNSNVGKLAATASADERCSHLSDERMREFFNSGAYDWRRYVDVLRHLRVSQLTLLLSTTKLIKRDGMIPKELIDCVMRDQWNTMLVNEEATSMLDESMDDDFFYRHCFRLGRSGNSGYGKTMWRWLGCFFGTDLLVNYSSGSIRFVRNCTNIPAQQHISVKMCDKIRIHYRLIVCSEEDSRIIFDTERRNAILELDGSVSVGLFKVPKSSFSIHVFYLASIPGPSSTFYWENLLLRNSQPS